jgi:hypothetical protein
MTDAKDLPEVAAPDPNTAVRVPMTKRSMASLVLKLLGIYLLTGIAIWAPHFISLFQQMTSSWGLFFYSLGWVMLGVIIWLAPPVVLLLWANAIAARLVREDEVVGKVRPGGPADVLRVVVMCLGISMVVWVIPELAGLVANAIQFKEAMDPNWTASIKQGMISSGVRLGVSLLLGGYLTLNPDKIVNLISHLRRPGGEGDAEESSTTAPEPAADTTEKRGE